MDLDRSHPPTYFWEIATRAPDWNPQDVKVNHETHEADALVKNLKPVPSFHGEKS